MTCAAFSIIAGMLIGAAFGDGLGAFFGGVVGFVVWLGSDLDCLDP